MGKLPLKEVEKGVYTLEKYKRIPFFGLPIVEPDKKTKAKIALIRIQAEFCRMCGEKDTDYCMKKCEWHKLFNLVMDELNGSA